MSPKSPQNGPNMGASRSPGYPTQEAPSTPMIVQKQYRKATMISNKSQTKTSHHWSRPATVYTGCVLPHQARLDARILRRVGMQRVSLSTPNLSWQLSGEDYWRVEANLLEFATNLKPSTAEARKWEHERAPTSKPGKDRTT